MHSLFARCALLLPRSLPSLPLPYIPHATCFPTHPRSAPACSASAKKEEMCVIVDENNQVVGAQPRGITVRNRLLGRGAYVLVFDPQGRLLVSRRSPKKDVYPGLLDTVVSGVVRAGDSYEETAVRELEEEIGVREGAGLEGLERLQVFRYSDSVCDVWGCLFAAQVGEGAARGLTFGDGEIQWAKFIPLSDVASLLQGQPEGFGAGDSGMGPEAGSALAGLAFTPVGRRCVELYLAVARGADV